jgi:hypothetical protein
MTGSQRNLNPGMTRPGSPDLNPDDCRRAVRSLPAAGQLIKQPDKLDIGTTAGQASQPSLALPVTASRLTTAATVPHRLLQQLRAHGRVRRLGALESPAGGVRARRGPGGTRRGCRRCARKGGADHAIVRSWGGAEVAWPGRLPRTQAHVCCRERHRTRPSALPSSVEMSSRSVKVRRAIAATAKRRCRSQRGAPRFSHWMWAGCIH